MSDDPKHKIRGNHHFARLPSGRQALIVAALFVALLLIALLLQALGLWPESWTSSFDGTTE